MCLSAAYQLVGVQLAFSQAALCLFRPLRHKHCISQRPDHQNTFGQEHLWPGASCLKDWWCIKLLRPLLGRTLLLLINLSPAREVPGDGIVHKLRDLCSQGTK